MSLPMIVPALQTAFAALGSMGPALQAALSVGSAAASYITADRAASAQEAATIAANEDARVQTISDYDQMTRRSTQELAAGQQRISDAQINSKKTAARVEASAGEGNIGGLSITGLLTDIYGQEARIRDGVNQNLEATGHQITAEKNTIARTFKNTIQTRAPVERPSLFGAVADAGLGIVSAYKDDLRTSAKANKGITARKGTTSNFSGR